MEIDAIGRRVLIIPDLHCPFNHVDSFRFLSKIKEKYLDSRSIIMNLGDEVDGNQISFHDKDPDMPFSPTTELEAAINEIQKLKELFPKMYLCESNHGSLVYRRQKAAGLPRHYFKSYQEILNTPKWHWSEDFILKTKLGPIYLCHGKTATYGKLAKEEGMSSVQGHYHGKFEVTWHKSKNSERFNCFAGCLINRRSMAFNYGKNHIPKAILGAVLISKQGYPKLIKMSINEKGRWDGRLP